MNKKVLSAILFSALFAGTGTFTSCIDNDEPAGIEELRGAKAELLRAKVAVEQAEAAHKLALAEVEKANAAIRSAVAKQEEATAKLMEAQAEAQEATTAQAKAEAEQAIAEAKNAMAEAALEHEANMVDLQKSLAIAKRQYELTLAQIEIAKQLFPFETYIELSKLQDDVEDAQDEVDDAAETLAEKKAEYDAAAIDYKYKGEIQKKRLENAVAKKEGLLAAAKEELAKWEGYLENDVETADWRAEVDSLDALVETLNKEIAKLNLEKVRLQQSDEYKALGDSVLEASKPAVLDTVYSYTYYGEEDSLTLKTYVHADGNYKNEKLEYSNGEELEKTYVAQMAINQLEVLDDNGKLIGGRIYNDSVKVSLFTAEKRALLDSIAKTEAADTTYQHRSDTTVANWEVALAAYKNVDNTDETKRLAAEAAEPASPSATATDYTAFRTALVAYYEAAAKNGAVFNQVPVETKAKVTLGGTEHNTNVTELKDWSVAFATDANVMYLDNKGFDFFGVDTAIGEASTDTIKYTDANANPAKIGYYTAIFNKAPKTALTLKNELEVASREAFGDYDLYLNNDEFKAYLNAEKDGGKYLTVCPDEKDVKFLYEYYLAGNYGYITESLTGYYKYGRLGAYGFNLLAKDTDIAAYAKTYKERIANYRGAIAYWSSKVAIMKAALEAQKAALEAANIAKEEYEIENIDAIGDQVSVIEKRISRIEAVSKAIKSAIQSYLEPELKGTSDYTNAGILQAKQTFKERLQKLAEGALEDVEEAEDNLADAQIALEKNGDEDSSYNLLEAAKVAYEEAQAELDEAQAKLDEALANLAKGLEILGVSAE